MTWLPNTQELVFAAGNVIVVMNSKCVCHVSAMHPNLGTQSPLQQLIMLSL